MEPHMCISYKSHSRIAPHTPAPQKNNNNLLLRMNSPGIAGMGTGLGEVGAHPRLRIHPSALKMLNMILWWRQACFEPLKHVRCCRWSSARGKIQDTSRRGGKQDEWRVQVGSNDSENHPLEITWWSWKGKAKITYSFPMLLLTAKHTGFLL